MSSLPKRTTLTNGLTVITKEMRDIPIVSLWVWYKVGSRNEVAGITGISHWVEHMQFKGTGKLKKGQVFDLVTANGGTLNAFTWIDFTTFYETLPSDKLDVALSIESDRMTNSLFDPEEVESERSVIISEREGLENSPGFLLSEELTSTAFKVSTYHHGTIGWKSDLRAITRDDLYNYYRTYYVPNNATVVVVGDFDTVRVLEKVNEYFGPILGGPPVPAVRSVEPPQIGERRVVVRHPAGTHYFEVGYHAPAASDPDAAPMLVADAILSGGKPMGMFGSRDVHMGRSSRLYRALVDSGITSGASSSFGLTKDPYLFGIDASLCAGSEPARVEQICFDEVEKLCNQLVGPEELERAKKQIRAQFIYGAETVGDQGYWLGDLETVGAPDAYFRLLDQVNQVSNDDIQRVANKYLTEQNKTTGWLIPSDESEGSAAGDATPSASRSPGRALFYVPFGSSHERSVPEMASARSSKLPSHAAAPDAGLPSVNFSIDRTELSNGSVVLGHHNDANPMVVLRASMLAGGVYETDELAGLAPMVAALLIRGTKNRTFEQLNDETDSLGMSINVEAGRFGIQVAMRALKEDFAKAVEILADVLQRPIFPENELEKLRGQVLTGLREQANSTQAVAARHFFELAYPIGHPFHRWPAGSEETITRLTRNDVIRFYEEHYRPQSLVFSVVGDVEFPETVRQLEQAFGGWAKAGVQMSKSVPLVQGPLVPVRKDLPVPGKTQSDIIIGLPTLPRDHPDYYALSMANLILGQLGLMGRLGENVRDKQGLAYYSSSDLQGTNGPSPWEMSAGVNPANVQRAIDSMLAELERWRTELVDEAEMEHARNYLIGRLPLTLESSAGIARMLIDIEFFGLGLDYLNRYPSIIQGLTREQLRDAVCRWIQPEHLVTIVAGPQT